MITEDQYTTLLNMISSHSMNDISLACVYLEDNPVMMTRSMAKRFTGVLSAHTISTLKSEQEKYLPRSPFNSYSNWDSDNRDKWKEIEDMIKILIICLDRVFKKSGLTPYELGAEINNYILTNKQKFK